MVQLRDSERTLFGNVAPAGRVGLALAWRSAGNRFTIALMTAIFNSYCLHGLNAIPIQLEVEVSKGMPYFAVIGMAGTSVQEAKERVRSAMMASGFKFPLTRKIVNLAPAEVPKSGSHFDLAIALGLMIESAELPPAPHNTMVIGELGLEGGVKGVSGVLPGVLFARDSGFGRVVLPAANLKEASLVDGIELVPVKSLREACQFFLDGTLCNKTGDVHADFEPANYPLDFADISGHAAAKRALLVAAAGGHHVLMTGPPGSGKSLLAQTFPSLLPQLSKPELLEVLKIYSIAGKTINHINMSRPFRNVHHTCTPFGLIGGGTEFVPGEISLAHHGVLFMDEFPEFQRATLEMLREPLESGVISLRRGTKASSFPCKFQMIAAMNPCPCGHYGDCEKVCRCGAAQIARYQSKVSGPILDRIDIQIEVPRIPYDELQNAKNISSAEMRNMVLQSQKVQHVLGRDLSSKQIKQVRMDCDAEEILRRATKQFALSGRGVHRTIKVARTIASLDGLEQIYPEHVMEALQYRLVA